MLESKVNIEVIKALVFEGFHILTIINSIGDIQYWSTIQFDVNTSGTEPVEFIQVHGININEFMKKAPPTSNVKEVVAQFEKFIEAQPKLIVKLPKYSEWQYYTM